MSIEQMKKGLSDIASTSPAARMTDRETHRCIHCEALINRAREALNYPAWPEAYDPAKVDAPESQASLAERLAREFHGGQFRRDGITPYITHPEAVAAEVARYGDLAQAVAWLHDVLENTSATLSELHKRGVYITIISNVAILTKAPGADYEEYIKRVAEHPIAKAIKIADIEHNLSCDPTQMQREKYDYALKILKEQRL